MHEKLTVKKRGINPYGKSERKISGFFLSTSLILIRSSKCILCCFNAILLQSYLKLTIPETGCFWQQRWRSFWLTAYPSRKQTICCQNTASDAEFDLSPLLWGKGLTWKLDTSASVRPEITWWSGLRLAQRCGIAICHALEARFSVIDRFNAKNCPEKGQLLE